MSRKKKIPIIKKKTSEDKKPSKYQEKIKIDASFNELVNMAAKGYGAKKKS